jgi:hypothetical protein
VNVINRDAGDGQVNQEVLDNLEAGPGADGDGLVEGNAECEVDGGTAVHLDGVGLEDDLVNGEGLAGALAEAVLQLLEDGVAGGGDGDQGGENEAPHVDSAVWAVC